MKLQNGDLVHVEGTYYSENIGLCMVLETEYTFHNNCRYSVHSIALDVDLTISTDCHKTTLLSRIGGIKDEDLPCS